MKKFIWAFNNSFPAAVGWLFVGYLISFWPALSEALTPWHYYLAGYFTLQCLLDGVLEPYYEARIKRREDHLTLDTQGTGDFPSRFAHFVDCHVMNRYSFFGYKNNVKSNLRIFSSLMLTSLAVFSVLTAVHFLDFIGIWPSSFGSQNTPSFYAGTLFFFAASFGLEKWSHFEKWKYLAERFQSLMEREPGVRRDVLEAVFVCDLIATNMWSHDSYNQVFEKNIVKSMSMYWGEYPFKATDLKFTRQDLLTRPIPKAMAQRAMHDRLERLIHAEKLEVLNQRQPA